MYATVLLQSGSIKVVESNYNLCRFTAGEIRTLVSYLIDSSMDESQLALKLLSDLPKDFKMSPADLSYVTDRKLLVLNRKHTTVLLD